MAIVASSYQNKVNAYYQATFGRQATRSELASGEANLLANDGSVWAGNFQQDLSTLKGWGTDAPTEAAAQTQVDGILSNLFGSQASSLDAAIAKYYVDALVAGSIKPRGVVNAIVNDLGILPKVDGSLGKPAGWGYGPGVELTTDQVDAYKTDIGYQPAPDPGTTYTLTTATDVITGTEKDDTIDGVASSLTSEKTLNPADQIDGGEGNDTLNVTMKGSFAGFSGDGFLKNVETVNLASDSNISREFDATGVTGVTTYAIDATTAAVTLKDLGDLNASIELSNQASGNFSAAYATDVTKGTSDKQALVFTNVGTVADTATSTSEAAVTTTIAGVEELTLDVSGKNVAAFTAAATTTMTITGDGDLKMTSGPAALTTLDASMASGDLNIDMTASTDATTVVLGAGDDTLTVNAGDVTKSAQLSGGAGADTLNLSATGTVQYDMSGFETLNLANTAALTFSAANTTDLTTIQANKAMTGNATFANLGTGDYTVDLLGLNTPGTTVLTLDHSGSTTLNVSSPSSTATATSPDTNDVDVKLTKSTALNMVVDAKMDYTGTVTATKATSVELDVQGEMTAATVSAAEATSVVVKAVENASTMTLTAAKATDLNITAAEDLDITAATLTVLETLTAATNGFLDLTVFTPTKIATVTLSGSGSVGLGNLGATTQDGYAITVSATGLSGDEAGALATRSLSVETIDTKGQDITVDASGVLGAVAIGAIDASGGGVATSVAGDVTINLDGVGGDFSLGAITGTDVTIDATGALGVANNGTADTYGNVTLDTGGSLDFKGINLEGNIIAAVATGTEDVTMTFVGGIDDDQFTVTSAAGFSGEVTVDATGGIATTTDILMLDGTTTALDIKSLSFDGMDAIGVGDGNTVTVKAADITGETFVLTGKAANDVLTVEGTASADTIDLSGITAGTGAVAWAFAGDLNILGSKGADTITASGAIDVFTYTAEDQFGDTISSFAAGTDSISLDVGGSKATAGKIFSAAAKSATATKTLNAFTKSMVSLNTHNGALTAKYALGTYADVTAFMAALNAFTITATATAKAKAVTAATHVAFGLGSSGTIWAAVVKATDFALTTASSFKAQVNSITANDVTTIGTVSGVAITDIVLV